MSAAAPSQPLGGRPADLGSGRSPSRGVDMIAPIHDVLAEVRVSRYRSFAAVSSRQQWPPGKSLYGFKADIEPAVTPVIVVLNLRSALLLFSAA